ncbi:MAG: hypothetical protein M3Y28_04145 [Armatimonadota bacterium]|nr:hypothetical protein [Armatimonadota bacterium]
MQQRLSVVQFLVPFVFIIVWGCGGAYFMYRRYPPKPGREKWASLLIWCIAGILAALASFALFSGGQRGTRQALLMLSFFLSVGITTEVCIQRRTRKKPHSGNDDTRNLRDRP